MKPGLPLLVLLGGCREFTLIGPGFPGPDWNGVHLDPPRVTDRFPQGFPLEYDWSLSELPDPDTLDTWADLGDVTFHGVFSDLMPRDLTVEEVCPSLGLSNCVLVDHDPVANAIVWHEAPPLGADVYVRYVPLDHHELD